MNGSRTNRINIRNNKSSRSGSVMAMMAFLLPVLAILAAFCINSAQMQLNRTELIVATDAAARAGGRAFSEEQTVAAAKDAAFITAALNNVDGQPLQIRRNDGANEIEFGKTIQPDGVAGRYEFQKIPTSVVESGQQFASAIRINGRRDTGSLSGRVPLIVPGLLDTTHFESQQLSVAMQVDRDISLILDRSGSMSWIIWDWPPGTNPHYTSTEEAGVSAGMRRIRDGRYRNAWGVSTNEYYTWVWEDYYNLGPAPTAPWDDLVVAVDAFLDVLDLTSQEEQVSVASYSSYATLDTFLEKDFDVIRDTVDGLRPGGATAIGRGMEEGILALLDSAARPFAAKTMVVMTDGIHNSGVSPVTVVNDLMGSYHLTVHTVTFGDGADQQLMQQVASTGGGKHYHAATGDQLVAIFEEIANNLPTILTK